MCACFYICICIYICTYIYIYIHIYIYTHVYRDIHIHTARIYTYLPAFLTTHMHVNTTCIPLVDTYTCCGYLKDTVTTETGKVGFQTELDRERDQTCARTRGHCGKSAGCQKMPRLEPPKVKHHKVNSKERQQNLH